jgi:hypothetical protein
MAPAFMSARSASSSTSFSGDCPTRAPSPSRGSLRLEAARAVESGTSASGIVASAGMMAPTPNPLSGSLPATAVKETSRPAPSAHGATVAHSHRIHERR